MTTPTLPFDREVRLPLSRRRRRGLRIIVIAVGLFLLLAPPIATRIADWMWYNDVGFERVFLTKIIAQWILGLAAGVGGFLILYTNARIAMRGLPTRNLHIRDASEWAKSGPQTLLERLSTWLVLPATLVLGLILALASAGNWRELAQFVYRTPFGVADPIFGRDVSYYVFTIPMVENVLTFASATLWLSLVVIALPIYLARTDIGVVVGQRGQQWRFYITPRAQMHLAVLGASILVVQALRVFLVDVPSLLLAQRNVLFGATYTDLHVRLPSLRVLAVLLLAAAGALIWYARRGQLARGAIVVVIAVIAGTIGIGDAFPGLYQRLVVQPNELARETPQIRHHLTATRQAWGINGVERRELTTERPLTLRDIDANQVTIRNVRLWDREPLLQTYGQIQSIRTYYDFVSVDDDRYNVNGELRQVLLAPRELNTSALPTRTFINEHLTYTHGMGVTLGPSNQVTPEGLPVLWIKDLPPVSTVPIRVTRPQIYFGELSNDFVLAPSRQREFDYPSGQGDAAVYSTYTAGTGVPIGSFLRRLLFAFRFGSLNIILSSDLTPSTRILFHRDVLERAQLALPFLAFDPDPYLVIANDGHLEWILDAYTTTDRYPYAQPLSNGVNYMRNSVKVVIDAYDGTLRAYRADQRDPITRTLDRMYPGLLHPLDSMPADLRAHVRYPEDLFRLQTALYATYHMADPETFYHREDQWQVPGAPDVGGPAGGERRAAGEAFMRHMVMRLPGERDLEFILMRPFTPRQKDNLAAWMVARNDGEHYGKLAVYRFPRQRLVFGPNQIVNRINQDTEVSRQITLWDQRGSEVLRGELLVLPIEGSLIYVQPLYLRAQGGQIPELKRVIAAHEGRVSMAETLDAALAGLVGGGERPAASPLAASDSAAAATSTAAATAGTASATPALVQRALEHYNRARAAQRSDDWATYGEEMRKLGEVLRQLEAPRGSRP
jgi:uncharacterized membrane protein (UPF0182 family)